ncbi:MAG TPA: antibiotic biosynthesis monooxygenase [Jiangellales bacterium]|nr:antibiotic biosynthesis monooxygenase [Jiangellales bacterium]
MLAVTRYRVAGPEAGGFLARARAALDVLATRPGWRRGTVGRATDDPELWVLVTEWADVGSYRRALGAYEVKVQAVPLLALALDEPTAYEVIQHLGADGGTGADHDRAAGSHRAADAATVAVGEASAPSVASDLA